MIRRRRRQRQASTATPARRVYLPNMRAFFVGALTLTVAWGAWALYRAGNVEINAIAVDGDLRRVTVAEVAAAAATGGIEAGFFDVDLHRVRVAVVALPWVQEASVRRVWPGTLHIHVTEQHPLARWAAGGLVNTQGELFYPPTTTGFEELPLFTGPEEALARLCERYLVMEAALAPLNRHIERISYDARSSWRVHLDQGTQLVLGREDSLERFRRFVGSYSRLTAEHSGVVEQVDLRYHNGFAVRWRRSDAGLASVGVG